MTRHRPLFVADWSAALFIHFRMEPQVLSQLVPFALDTWEGDAIVSLVAFTQQNLRPARGGRLAALVCSPLSDHPFLNLRAYVRVNGEPAIYFLSEWIPNRLAALIGPRLYGLPYRLGQLRYKHDRPAEMSGCVVAPAGRFAYRAGLDTATQFGVAAAGSIDRFLLERYAAFTYRDRVARRFEVEHAPWRQTRATVELLDTSLVRSVSPAMECTQVVGANFSPGVCDVAISSPQKIPETTLICG